MITKFILSFVVILFNLYIIRYTNILKNTDCECYESNKYRIRYIFGYATLTIGVVLLYYTIPIFINLVTKKPPEVFAILANPSGKLFILFELYLIAGLLNLAIIYNTTHQIIQSRCNCADKIERKVLYYYSITVLIIYILSFIVSLDLYIS